MIGYLIMCFIGLILLKCCKGRRGPLIPQSVLFPWTECNVFNFQEPVIVNLIWVYYMSKMLDWLDTLFIILGNKPKQFSFLHVYHHTSVWFMNWLNLVINFDAEIFVSIGWNAFIHVILYNGCNQVTPRGTALYLAYIMSLFILFLNFF